MREKPKIHTSQIVYSGFFDVHRDFFEKEGGVFHSFTSLRVNADAAVVLAQDQQGRWILNREYRHPTREFLLGCPGGRLEKGEDPLEGGRRELLEETGYSADELYLIGTCYQMPSVCNQKIYFLLAKNAFKKRAQALDPMEMIEIELKTDEQLKKEMREGSCIDALLCTALWYKSLFEH